MSHPRRTPKIPPSRPIAPASAKNSLRMSGSEAPSALRTPISRRRSRMAIQRIDDSQRGHGQRQAAENSQKKIEDHKHEPEAAGDVLERKPIEAHLLDRVFHVFHFGGVGD